MDEHAGCRSAYEVEKRRREFLEARLSALSADIHTLAHRVDGIGGQEVYERLGNKTLGGAVRALLQKEGK